MITPDSTAAASAPCGTPNYPTIPAHPSTIKAAPRYPAGVPLGRSWRRIPPGDVPGPANCNRRCLVVCLRHRRARRDHRPHSNLERGVRRRIMQTRQVATASDRPTKICAVCGRTITWRKKWTRDWPEVRYCSDACRRRTRGAGSVDADLDRSLAGLLAARGATKTVCPSEVARAVGGAQWRDLMEPARAAARRAVARGEAEMTQRGHVVDPSTAKGPVRIRPIPGGKGTAG